MPPPTRRATAAYAYGAFLVPESPRGDAHFRVFQRQPTARTVGRTQWRRHMNSDVGHAQIGQWYLHRDKGEIFQVIDRDEEARTIEIQTFGGALDEIDEESWRLL